jgi:hypothetical protein
MKIQTAKRELCQKLSLLSGWSDTDLYWYVDWLLQDTWRVGYLGTPSNETTIPAYDLGYLIRNLPAQVSIKREYDASPELPEETPAQYRALYDTVDGCHFWLGEETPEDAACVLAIELFKQGVLS